MFPRKLFIIAVLYSLSSVWALNTLHHAQYSFYPQPFLKNRTQIQVGGHSLLQGDAALPFAWIYGLGNHAEIAFKYELSSQEQDFNKKNLANTMDLGFRFKISDIETIQLDVMLGLGKDDAPGLILGYDIYHGLTKSFQVIYQAKASFFDGLNPSSEIALIEVGLYPRIRFGQSFHIITGLSYSNSLTSPIDYQAFDIAPGFELKLAHGGSVQFYVDMGVAGKSQQEPFLYHLAYIHNF